LTGVQLHEFQIGDYREILRLWKEAGLVIRPGDDLGGVEQKLQRDPDLFLVAREGDEIVGCVMGGWDGRRGWIYHLAVKASRRRRGIAKALMKELEARLAQRGAKKVNAQVYRSNTASLRFFDECGYEANLDLIMIGKSLDS